MDWGRIFKQAGKGMAGRAGGAVIGQLLIPIPGLGAAVGAFVGGWAATGKVTSGIVGIGLLGDAFGVAGDVVTSAATDIGGSVATDVGSSVVADVGTSTVSVLDVTPDPTDMTTSYADAATGVTAPTGIMPSHGDSYSLADTDGSLNGHGNAGDTNIFGTRPTDIQGNEIGRNGQGNIPSDILGRPMPG